MFCVETDRLWGHRRAGAAPPPAFHEGFEKLPGREQKVLQKPKWFLKTVNQETFLKRASVPSVCYRNYNCSAV